MKALRLALWFLGFGLLPFWVTLTFAIVGGTRSPPENYWATIPWFILISIPYSGFTMAMAAVTHVVYVRTAGGWSRKVIRAGGCLVAMCAVIVIGIAILWHRHTSKEAAAKAEQEAGRLLVERSDLVASVAPPGFRVGSSSRTSVDRVLVRFQYYVYALDNSSGENSLPGKIRPRSVPSWMSLEAQESPSSSSRVCFPNRLTKTFRPARTRVTSLAQ